MADTKEKLSPEEEASRKEASLVKYWLQQIGSAQKREKKWRKEAHELERIYEGEHPEMIPYNILYSNTETLTPALYSATPRPDTRPRTAQESATALASAGLVDAFLENFIDNGDQGYCSFDTATKAAVKAALVPGRGVQRFHYIADIEKDEKGPRKVRYERIDAEELAWDKILHGHAKRWIDVPWVAFEHVWTEDEAIAEMGEEHARQLTFSRREKDDREENESDIDELEAVTTVWEIWHKKNKEILWLESCAKDRFAKETEKDPYQLAGFYPIQEPMRFMRRISSLLPVPLYRLYKKQAEELNKVTRRIDSLIDQMKIRGFYHDGVEGLKDVLEASDGVMKPVQNLQSLGPNVSIENAVWLVPVEKHVVVLQQLIQQRQAIKQVIFEIMGIADIMRGSSVASETLGAQKIKNQWGTLRLKEAQAETSRFIRDGLRIAAELAFTKLSPDTLRRLTGSKLPSAEELKGLEMAAQQAQASGQQIPPDMMAKMGLPAFEECLEALRDDLMRSYLIDIETNSSIDADAAEDKEQITEFLGAFSQLLNGLGPMLEKGVLPFDAAKAVMLSISKRFNLGKQLYRELARMQPPASAGGPDPKVQKEMESKQQALEQQAKQQADEKTKLELEKIKFDAEKRVFEAERRAQEAITAAKDQARQAQATAQGAVKSANDKAAKAKQDSDVKGLMTDLSGVLQQIQAAAKEDGDRRKNNEKVDAERKKAQIEAAGIDREELSGIKKLVQELQQTVTASVGKKPMGAKKGPDGAWTFKYQ